MLRARGSSPSPPASKAVASLSDLETYASKRLLGQAHAANDRAHALDSKLASRRGDRGLGTRPLSVSEARALDAEERRLRQLSRLNQVRAQSRVLEAARHAKYVDTRQAIAKRTAAALHEDWEDERAAQLRELEERRMRALQAASPQRPMPAASSRVPEPTAAFAGAAAAHARHAAAADDDDVALLRNKDNLDELEARLERALEAVRQCRPSAAATAAAPATATAAPATTAATTTTHRSRLRTHVPPPPPASRRPISQQPPASAAPERAKLVLGDDDVLVLGDEGFSVESLPSASRLADTRWFELKEEELSRSSDEASAMVDSLSEVRAMLDGAKALLHRARADDGRDANDEAPRAPAAAAAPPATVLDRLQVGKRAAVPEKESLERTRRNAARLPEVAEHRGQVESRRAAEERRRKAREWEDNRRRARAISA